MTASGKSALAHKIAIERNLDIISLDSMAVYKGLDILTDKPTEVMRSQVLYYGIDIADPDQNFSVVDYLNYLIEMEIPEKSFVKDFASEDNQKLVKKLFTKIQNEKEFVFEGDIKNGLLVSQKHCKRCHVVDDNAFAGIDSSPSFHAMRSFEDWEERFRAFWTVSPHLNVISIKEVHDAGSKLSPVVIAPIELSLDDIDDILSYVSKIKPKDLGKPINFW